MSSLNKINRYLYELNYKDILNIDNLPFEELVEKLISMNEQERKKAIELLDIDKKEKIQEMRAGGLL